MAQFTFSTNEVNDAWNALDNDAVPGDGTDWNSYRNLAKKVSQFAKANGIPTWFVFAWMWNTNRGDELVPAINAMADSPYAEMHAATMNQVIHDWKKKGASKRKAFLHLVKANKPDRYTSAVDYCDEVEAHGGNTAWAEYDDLVDVVYDFNLYLRTPRELSGTTPALDSVAVDGPQEQWDKINA